jgi:HEAT repeat protein
MTDAGGDKVIAALERVLDDPVQEVADTAKRALRRRRGKPEPVVVIPEIPKEERPRMPELMAQQNAAGVKRKLRPLLERLSSKDDRVGYGAAKALANVGGLAVPALVGVLKGNDAVARERAAFALGHIGTDANEAQTELVAALKAKELPVRRRASEALAQIGPPTDQENVDALLAALKDDDVEVRLRVAETLAKLGNTGLRPLMNALADTDARVRWGAADALGNLEPKATRAVPLLKDALKDSDAAVRKAAEQALASIEAK